MEVKKKTMLTYYIDEKEDFSDTVRKIVFNVVQ